MKKLVNLYAFILLILIFSTLSCEDSENSFFPAPGDALVVISLNMLPENPSAYENTIWNRIRQFFVPNAIAQTAPATFTSILVRASSGGATLVEKTFTPTEALSVSVPAGSARQIEVIATVAADQPTAALSFRGAATVDLSGGSTTTVTVAMLVNETKIVIPDQYGYRIVQINDINGAGWIARTGSQIGFTGTFYPNDVDFDARGRIYIANNSGVSGSDSVLRIDNMNASTHLKIGSGSNSGIMSIAVDRVRNYVYYTTGALAAVKRCGLDGAGDTTMTITGGTISSGSIRGIDVDQESGNLYFACILSSTPSVVRLSITGTTGAITASQSLTGGSTSWDVVVKSPYVYVAQTYTGTSVNNRIIQFDQNLTTPVSSAPFIYQSPSATYFLGPHRFVAILNRRFYVINENENEAVNNNEGIIGFDDLAGANWTNFLPSSIGQSSFYFYSNC